MVQDNYTIKNRKGKHLNKIERTQIETYIKSGQIIKYIANTLGRCIRTIKRVKVTGLLKQLNESYSYQIGQKMYNKQQANKKRK